MRILHTSDWHLGKCLEGYSRLEEQQQFMQELSDIADSNNIDMILISGDIYDNNNPSAAAEKLFYSSTKKLSLNGKRPIVIIAGNHDSPERLTAVTDFAYEHGIIILGTPKSIAQVGQYKCYNIISSSEGCLEMELKGERIIIIFLPYPTEKRLNEFIYDDLKDETIAQKTYSDKIASIFNNLSLNYREDTINLAMAHLFMTGADESDSERQIQLGGALAVNPSALPQKAQYVALGHLHRPQKVKHTSIKAFYSGSPIQYSKSEINYKKCVYIIDVKPNTEAQVQQITLKNYKPIEIWDCSSIEEAIEKCEYNKNKNIWVYIKIHTDRMILSSEIKTMKSLKKDIIEIQALLNNEEEINEQLFEETKSAKDLFIDFYYSQNKTKPQQELIDLFMSFKEEINEITDC